MSNPRITRTDKNIVERVRKEQGSVSTRAMKSVRQNLNASHFSSSRFEREQLQMFASNHLDALLFFPTLILAVGAISYQWLGLEMVIGWICSMMLIYGYLLFNCRTIIASKPADIDVGVWRGRVIKTSIVIGLGWALLFVPQFLKEIPLTYQVFQFSALLCVMALVAMVAYPMKYVLSLTITAPVLVLAVRFAIHLTPVNLTMAAVLVIAQAFFAVLSQRLYQNAIGAMNNQAEKDELIAELETASSISEEARRRAEEANLAKSRFLATMSHELRTPLNAILGFSEVMAKEVLGPLENPQYREYINDIHGSGAHLLNLINEILDLSRIEAGRHKLNEEAVQLAYVAEDCSQLIKLKVNNKGINLVEQIDPQLPRIWADERAIRQIILNLLSNAVKFTPTEGTITMKIGWTAGGGQYVSIRDTGPGIPEDEIPVVLSSFGQGTIAIKSAEEGTGLGLPIVQALVEKHQGTFKLKSKIREGTEAIVTLPSTRTMEIMPPLRQNAPPMETPDPVRRARRSLFKTET